MADNAAASPGTKRDAPPNRFEAWEPITADPSYTFVNEPALRFGISTTMGSTIKEPTTVKLAKPVLLGFGAELTLYCPAFTRPVRLVVVASGTNAAVSRPPPVTPSFRVNAADPLVLKLIGFMSLPLVPI